MTLSPLPWTSAPRWTALFLAAAALACPAHAGTVRTFSGDHLEGDLHLDNGAVTVAVKGQPTQRIELLNVLRAEFRSSVPGVTDGTGPGVQLRNGAVVGGRVASIDASAVHLIADGHPLDFPLANVARALFASQPDSALAKIPRGFVGALLPGGDLFEGECRGMTEHPPQVKVNSRFLGVRHFGTGVGADEILAVALHDLAPATGPDAYRVQSADGSAYGVASLQTTGDTVTFHDPMAGDVKIPLKLLAEIRAGFARALPLGGLRAQAVGSANPAKVPAVFTMDVLAPGVPIALAGQSYEGGIAQAAGVTVTYAVPSGFGVFSAQVGLPAGAPATATVVFSLLVDGQAVWHSPPVAAGTAPLPVHANLGTIVHTMTLAVEPSSPASLGTPAAWADAVLLRP